jgi:hypothetical protein
MLANMAASSLPESCRPEKILLAAIRKYLADFQVAFRSIKFSVIPV